MNAANRLTLLKRNLCAISVLKMVCNKWILVLQGKFTKAPSQNNLADIRLDILIFTIRVANQSYNK